MTHPDNTAAALARRATHSGHGCADVDAPQPALDLTDPEIIRALGEFNAGVERAKHEYAEHPLTAYGRGVPKGTRTCPECGNHHKAKKRLLCWRCIPPRTAT